MRRLGSTHVISRVWLPMATSRLLGEEIIIRGGEHIPAVEIEALLHGRSAGETVAIVAMPGPRLEGLSPISLANCYLGTWLVQPSHAGATAGPL